MPDWSSNTWKFFKASFHKQVNVGVLFTPPTPAFEKYTGFYTLPQWNSFTLQRPNSL